jgi:hypothetical protein
MMVIPFTRTRPTAATPARVVVGPQDSFATAEIYKWILMQLLKSFHEANEIHSAHVKSPLCVTQLKQTSSIARAASRVHREPWLT